MPLCADESCHTSADVERLAGRYEFVNVKLDKTGGLTEALAVVAAARNASLGVLVGCMVGTSLAMAPAALLASGAEFVDLDGPLLLQRDRNPGLRYEGSLLHPSRPGPLGLIPLTWAADRARNRPPAAPIRPVPRPIPGLGARQRRTPSAPCR